MARSVGIPAVLLCLGCAGPGWPTAGAASPRTRCSSGAATCVEGAVQPAAALAAPGDTDTQLSLLQRHSSQQDPERLQAARLEALRPIAWMHVPKAGSSFLNFLIHLPGNCPGIPDDAGQLPEDFDAQWDMFGANGSCPGTFTAGNGKNRDTHTLGIYHPGIRKIYDAYKGHWATMLRQPEQRLVSAYKNGRQLWNIPRNASDSPRDMLEYAQVMAGCTVKMLTRAHDWPCKRGELPPPDENQVAVAIERLSAFGFVGLTNEWALSMCLGHRMFGGHCRSSDFLDTRVTPPGDHLTMDYKAKRGLVAPYNEVDIAHDTSELQGFRDPYDGPLYEAAKRRFKEDCAKYDVSVESCRLCFQEAGVKVSA